MHVLQVPLGSKEKRFISPWTHNPVDHSSCSHHMHMLQVLHYSEEKIGLSQQIYDYVDQKIRRLDRDLKNFEGDIARERSKLGIPVSHLCLHPSLW
jgi:hypothetical protein